MTTCAEQQGPQAYETETACGGNTSRQLINSIPFVKRTLGCLRKTDTVAFVRYYMSCPTHSRVT